MKKFYLESLGCAKNQVDSEIIISTLTETGFLYTGDAAEAELIIVNSCGFIEKAKQESINTVISLKAAFPKSKIILAGCLAVRYAKELKESLTEADAVSDSTDPKSIAGFVNSLYNDTRHGGGDVKTQIAQDENLGKRYILSLKGSAYIKIADGCDNRCSFCAIPLIRGSLRSRSISSICKEFKLFIGRNIKEINLIAQDLASYGKDISGNCLLPELLKELSKIEGDFWVRLLYLHPDHFPFSIIHVMKKDKRFLPYFDIPFQHASEKILKAMNRNGNAGQYLDLIKKIRCELPSAVIRSTFLTGFPGETGDDFKMLCEFQNEAGIDWLGVFTYSREEDTKAYSMKTRPSKKTALERKNILELNQIPITEKQMDRFTGKNVKALVEEVNDGLENIYLGRLFCHAPEVDGSAVIESDGNLNIGEFVDVRITGRAGFDLRVQTA
ncbi:ribosomal protein S12 methylthiotransferase RimO [Spirochaetia bacterium]|nr:ribosomal protein S12 methylthiotransferase RimO [Spirochaetia bacterium]